MTNVMFTWVLLLSYIMPPWYDLRCLFIHLCCNIKMKCLTISALITTMYVCQVYRSQHIYVTENKLSISHLYNYRSTITSQVKGNEKNHIVIRIKCVVTFVFINNSTQIIVLIGCLPCWRLGILTHISISYWSIGFYQIQHVLCVTFQQHL